MVNLQTWTSFLFKGHKTYRLAQGRGRNVTVLKSNVGQCRRSFRPKEAGGPSEELTHSPPSCLWSGLRSCRRRPPPWREPPLSVALACRRFQATAYSFPATPRFAVRSAAPRAIRSPPIRGLLSLSFDGPIRIIEGSAVGTGRPHRGNARTAPEMEGREVVMTTG